MYLFLLFYFLFFAENLGRMNTDGEYRYNLTLFREIRRYLKYGRKLGIKTVALNLAGNVLAFVPFGFCLPLLWRRQVNCFVTTVCAFSLSLLAETLQLVFRLGCFDVDDVLLNTLGGLSGYLLCYVSRKMKRDRK